MSKKDLNTRRAFLAKAATSFAAMVCASGLSATGEVTSKAGSPRGWLTTGSQRYHEVPVSGWESNAGAASHHADSTIEIDPSQTFQSILGVGGAFTDSSCFLFNQMDPAGRRQLLQELFSPEGLHFSVARTCIGSSDYSRTTYTYDDTPVPDCDLNHFSIEHDRAYILPTLCEAASIQPDLFFFSTPWSPPAWMKAGDSLLGGSMRKLYFDSYAKYFVKFIDAYKTAGINIRAVTTQNEVDTDQDGKMPAALWGQEYEAEFVKSFLAPALKSASLDTKIWLLDHNFNLWGRVMDLLSDPDVYRAVDGVAWHAYVGEPDAMTRVHDAFPAKSAYFTEYGPFVTDADYLTGWAKWSASYTQFFRNWARCAVAWNLLLNEKGGPNLGPFTCGGVVTIDSKTQQLTRSGQYWALAHFSKAVQRGARVIATTSSHPGVDHVGFANPDGTFVLVLTNQAKDRDIQCTFQGMALCVSLPTDSVLTLQWT
jgi:glucosylceramidase